MGEYEHICVGISPLNKLVGISQLNKIYRNMVTMYRYLDNLYIEEKT